MVVPLAGGLASIAWMDRYQRRKILQGSEQQADRSADERRYKLLSIAIEMFFIASPVLILCGFGLLTFVCALCIILVCWLIFFFALAIHRGADVESFVIAALMAIMIPGVCIAVSTAYSASLRRSIEMQRSMDATSSMGEPGGKDL